MNELEIVKTKVKDSVILFRYEDIYNFDVFFKEFLSKISMNQRYSLLVRVSYLNKYSGDYTQYKMLGSQIGFEVCSLEDLKGFVGGLFETINKRLELSMDNYNYHGYDVINMQILVFGMNDIKLNKGISFNRKSLGDHKDLFNSSSLLDSFRYVGLNLDRSKLGVMLNKTVADENVVSVQLLDGSFINIADKINKHNNKKVTFGGDTEFYYNEGSIVILNHLDGKEHIGIYSTNGIHINDVEYNSLGDGKYTRTMDNVKLFINNTGVYKKEISINFGKVYPYKVSGKVSKMIQPD